MACFVMVKDVQPEIRPEVTRKSWNFFETADVTDRRALSLALLATPKSGKGGSEVERAAPTAS